MRLSRLLVLTLLLCAAAGNFPAPVTGMSANGFKAVIAKPFTLQELQHTLNLAMVPSTHTIH